MICTFFGHRDAPKEIKKSLKKAIIKLVNDKNVNTFYVGSNGSFDRLVTEVLKDVKNKYKINYYIVLAYIPKKDEYYDYSNTIYFDELNTVPYKFRIRKQTS